MTKSIPVILTMVTGLLLGACGPSDSGLPSAEVDAALPASDSETVTQEVIAGAPAKKVLSFTWQGQQTNYWCGPASTRMALSARKDPPTQTTLATELGTTVWGTNHIGLVVDILNKRFGKNVYSSVGMDHTPTAAQRKAFKQNLVATLANGYPMVGNVVSGWRPPGYPDGTIYHYVAIVGYDAHGDKALVADPAGGCAVWCTVPETYWLSTEDLATWIGGKGYTASNLTVTPPAPAKPAAPKPAPEKPKDGILRGVIFQGGDDSNRVSGVTVSVAGKSMTTGADGGYSFSLPPGTYAVTASKSGFEKVTSAQRQVTSGKETWNSLQLKPVAAPAKPTPPQPPADTRAPSVRIESPTPNAHVEVAVWELSGTAADDSGAVTSVNVSVNGGAATQVGVANGQFVVDVKLKPGTNTLTVTAKDAAGNVGTAKATVTFDTGLRGFVSVTGEASRAVGGAKVAWLDPKTGAELSQTTSDAQTGAFFLNPEKLPATGLLLVTAPGFHEYRMEVTVPEDRLLELEVALTDVNAPKPMDTYQGEPLSEAIPSDQPEKRFPSDASAQELMGSCAATGVAELSFLGLAMLAPLLRRRRQ